MNKKYDKAKNEDKQVEREGQIVSLLYEKCSLSEEILITHYVWKHHLK